MGCATRCVVHSRSDRAQVKRHVEIAGELNRQGLAGLGANHWPDSEVFVALTSRILRAQSWFAQATDFLPTEIEKQRKLGVAN